MSPGHPSDAFAGYAIDFERLNSTHLIPGKGQL